MADAPSDYRNFRDLRSEYQHHFHKARMWNLATRVAAGESVLDVGCNGGYLAEYLPHVKRYVGIDPSRLAVGYARARGCYAEVGLAEDLPYPDKGFDVVVLAHLLERVADPRVVLAEAKRVCSRVIIGDTTHELGRWGPTHVAISPDDLRCFSVESLRALLSEFGTVRTIDELSWDGPTMLSFVLEVA